MKKIFQVVAVSDAGDIYKTYIKDLHEAVLVNSGNYEELEKIRQEALNILNEVKTLQGRIKYPSRTSV